MNGGWIDVFTSERTAFPECANDLHSRGDGPTAVAHYRIYSTTTDGHVTAPPTVIECSDDHEAIDKAAQLANGRSVELWEGARFIVRFPSDEGSGHAPTVHA